MGKLIDEVTRDWQWLSFLAQYCTGRNIGKAFCEENVAEAKTARRIPILLEP